MTRLYAQTVAGKHSMVMLVLEADPDQCRVSVNQGMT